MPKSPDETPPRRKTFSLVCNQLEELRSGLCWVGVLIAFDWLQRHVDEGLGTFGLEMVVE
jgi:hypothetical protein